MIRQYRKAQIQRIKYQFSKLIKNDIFYDNLRYFFKFKQLPNLYKPQTFNEKIIWRKQNEIRENLELFVDKISAKNIVLSIDKEMRISKTYCIVNQFADIVFNNLPSQFIIKTNHGSGWNIIVRDKKKINYYLMEKICTIWLSMNYYYLGREFPYKKIAPRLFVEELLLDNNNELPNDIKLFCFKGKVKLIQIDIDRALGHRRIILDEYWNILPVEYNYPGINTEYIKPIYHKKIIQQAEKLAEDFDFVRIDLYVVGNEIYFGEFTFYPESGLGKIKPVRFELEWGKLITG